MWEILQGETPQKAELIYKKLYTYSYMFKFQSPSKYSLFDAIHLLRQCFHCSKQFLNLFLMPSSASAIFVSPSPHWQIVSLWGLSSSGKTKKDHSGRDQVNIEGGALGSCCFGSKTAEHSVQCGQVHSSMTHHEMGKWVEGVFKKKIAEAKRSLSHQCQLVHWCRCVTRTLT